GGSPHFITCDNYLTSIDDPESTPETIEVGQNYPNPFNPSTVINYSLAEGGNIFFRIYDIQGREVATILDEYREAGHHSLMIDAAKYSLNSGVYFYCLSAGGKTITRKMVLLK
ncbi:MAG: T9SS type A sorting domain-containing protein, partial [Ignavibacteriaceae bacterium]|nr:T9SS type A sorting domain-containing protein [Ignavibacteriaceae bacterium]